MKNKIYYLGIATCIIILSGCLFKIYHWPSANMQIIAGIVLFCFVFIPTAIISSYKAESNKSQLSLYIAAFITIVINMISALFKICHWPGAEILLIISIPLPFVLFLPVYLIHQHKEKEINYRNFIFIFFFFAYFAAISALLALNVSKNILDESVMSSYELDNKTTFVQQQIKMHLDGLKPQNARDSVLLSKQLEVTKKSSEIILNIQTLIQKLAIATGTPVDKQTGNIDYYSFHMKDNISTPKLAFSPSELNQLENQISAFKNQLLQQIPIEKAATRELILQLLITDNNQQVINEHQYFENKNVIAFNETFCLLKYNIAVATLESLKIED